MYFFKVLTGQGPAAPDGRVDYVDENGNMTRGNALLAWPAVYHPNISNCFVISNTGTVYQRDLGPNTSEIVPFITEYNPDSGWMVAD